MGGKSSSGKNITKWFSWFLSGKVWIDTNKSFQRLMWVFFFLLDLSEKTSTSHSAVIIQPNPSLFIPSPPKSVYFIVTYSQGRKNGTRTEHVSQLQGQNCWRPELKSDCKIKKAIPILEITHMCVCVYIHINVHKHICMCIYVYMHTFICACVYTCIRMHI